MAKPLLAKKPGDGTPASPVKRQTRQKVCALCHTLAFTMKLAYLVWVFAGKKIWEGRLLSQVVRKGGLPCPLCTLVLFAGTKVATYHSVLEVRVGYPSDVLTKTNWKLFVPWVDRLSEAVKVYTEMDGGSELFVFFRLSPPYKTRHLGFTA